jgi:anti-sigma factor (TIGR02949 family)
MTQPKIDCEQALKQILTYLDRELGEGEREAMHRHLHTCKSCFSRMEFERLLKGKVAKLRDEEPTQSMQARIRALLKNF